ncbi:hypothetical protein HMPREF1218_0612 [Hoylesella pleuritidis F0068]|uniref:Uncharacterized protein n=1 Tax=Hoylesella pleuritidis F0068 TaxID=1081904 RepID=U2MG72_9BACT|nr:hypothetical protein HMPREF1218_0612 [Hoylesella pleuritidis F0068]
MGVYNGNIYAGVNTHPEKKRYKECRRNRSYKERIWRILTDYQENENRNRAIS